MSQRDSQRSRANSTNPCTTVQDIDVEESNARSNGPCLSESVTRDDEGELRSACVIEIACDGLSGEDDNNNNTTTTEKNQRMCRICHLNEKESCKRDDKASLNELGCGCKGELGFAHSDCADSWFKVRGNRLCEICNETAANVAGVSSGVRFVEADNVVTRLSDDRYYMANASDSNRRFFGGQTLCNVLMACLVLAFILPWFLRIDVF